MQTFDLSMLSEALANDQNEIIELCSEEIKLRETVNQRKAKNLARIVLWWSKYCDEITTEAKANQAVIDEEKIDIKKK
jgi:hypothetical protein